MTLKRIISFFALIGITITASLASAATTLSAVWLGFNAVMSTIGVYP